MILRVPPPPSPIQHHHHHHVVVLSPIGSPPSPQSMASILELPRQSQAQAATGSHLQFQSTSTVEGPHSHQYHFHVMSDLQATGTPTPTALPETVTDSPIDPEASNFALQQSRRLRDLFQILQATGFKVDLRNPLGAHPHHESQSHNGEESHAAHAEEIRVTNGIVNQQTLEKVLRTMMQKNKMNTLVGGDSWRRHVHRSGQTDVEAGGDLDVPTSTSVIDELRDLLKETEKLKYQLDIRDGR